MEVILRAFPAAAAAAAAAAAEGEGTPAGASAGPLQEGLRHLLDAPKEALIEAERSFLTRALALLQVLPCLSHAAVRIRPWQGLDPYTSATVPRSRGLSAA